MRILFDLLYCGFNITIILKEAGILSYEFTKNVWQNYDEMNYNNT